jgi:hypothetical protein
MNGMLDEVSACSRALSPRIDAQLSRRFVIFSIAFRFFSGVVMRGCCSGYPGQHQFTNSEDGMKKAPNLDGCGAADE